jgi:O-succinylbenzoic acid--CoA ligase
LETLKPKSFSRGSDVEDIQDWLLWRSTVSPHQAALEFDSVRWDYEELQKRVSALSGLLLSWGLKKRDRVGLLLNPSETYVAAVHALGRIGAVVVPLNVKQSSTELLWQLKDCSPSVVLYDPSLSDLKRRIEEESKGRTFRWRSSTELRIDTKRNAVYGDQLDASSLHSIIYTSGSTGAPKGVELTVSNLLWSAVSFGIQHGASSSDRWLLVMPLFHVGGYMILFRSVLHGSCIILHPRFEASNASKSLDLERITLVSLVPTMFRDLLRVHREPFPPSLRMIFLGGSQTPSSLMRMILERRLPVLLTYGMTETCSQVAISPVLSSGKRGENSYHAIFPTTISTRNDRASRSRLGKVGEIVVRGPTVFGGYWRSRETTSAASKDGWFCTGDLGFLNDQGGVVVLGRKEDMIISGGENIYPIEVESSLLEHEAIEDAVVIGREDRRWGQRVEAVVKLKENFDSPSPPELRRFLAQRIGAYKIPKGYHFWASIPQTSSGKTKRETIRELVERGTGGRGRERKDTS